MKTSNIRISRFLLGAVVVAVGMSFNASALNITPSSPPPVLTGTSTSQADINQEIADFVAGDSYNCEPLTLVYKQDVGGPESGSFASSYATSFSDTPTDPSGATIDYISGASISGEHIFLLVKDGNHDPAYYFFDISSWNGTDDLALSAFWPQQGAISHVDIYTCDTTTVPDGGATLMLLGTALTGLGVMRRFLKR